MKNLSIVLFLLLSSSTACCQDFEIYVSDAGNFKNPPWQILKFDKDGDNPEVFINQNLAWPQDIVFLEDQDTVLVSNLNSGQINRYNEQTGAYVNVFAAGIGGPTRMKIGPDNLLYVLQWNGNGKVRRYELDGTFVNEFTSVGVPKSIGLDWDSSGNLYVSSYGSDSVQKFDSSGKDLGTFINSNLTGPTNIWFAENGDLLVSDYDGNAIKRFDSGGNFLGNFIQGLSHSEGVGFSPNGNILIGNGATSSVKMYASNGSYIEDIIPSHSGNLKTPNAVVIRLANTDGPFQINAGLNDAWFNPATAGQGFFITVFPEIKQIFLAWFTFDAARPAAEVAANLGEPGHRWLTAFGAYTDNQAVLDIEITQGGVFDAVTPVPEQNLDGTITLDFSGCNAGMVTYDITSISAAGVIPIQRIALDNVAHCEALAAQADLEK